MSQHTGTGTCVSVSTSAPATHDSGGFGALVYTQLGELESVGEINIRHETVNFTNLCSGKTSMSKGAEQGVEFDITLAMDRADAGQVIMTAARKSLTQKVSIKIEESTGDKVYLQAYVLGERVAGGAGPNDTQLTVYTLGVVAPKSGDTAVVVPYTPPPPSSS